MTLRAPGRLDVTSYRSFVTDGQGDDRLVAQFIRFGTGGREVPVVVVFMEGTAPAQHRAILADPQSAELPADLAVFAGSGLPGIDLVMVHAPYIEIPTWVEVTRARSAAEDLLAQMRKNPPQTMAFIGIGQGAASATSAGIASAATASIAILDGRGTRDAVRVSPRGCPRFTPALFVYRDRDREEELRNVVGWRTLARSTWYFGDVRSLVNFTLGGLRQVECERRGRGVLRAMVRRRTDGAKPCVYEASFRNEAGDPDFSFEAIPGDSTHVRAVTVPKKERELRVRWRLTPTTVSFRIAAGVTMISMRLRVRGAPSLLGAIRTGDGDAYAVRPCWNLASRAAWRYDDAETTDSMESDPIRDLFERSDRLGSWDPLSFRETRRLMALLLGLSREARRRCDPELLATARRFHPGARWLVYRGLAGDQEGRFQRLVDRLPGLLVLAAGFEAWWREPEVDRLLARYVGGEISESDLLNDMCDYAAREGTVSGQQSTPEVVETIREVVRATSASGTPSTLVERVEEMARRPRLASVKPEGSESGSTR